MGVLHCIVAVNGHIQKNTKLKGLRASVNYRETKQPF